MTAILTVPHPTLRQVAKPVAKVDKKILSVIAALRQALLSAKDPAGVGLAAPQIGVPLRLFFIRPNLKKPPQLFINPEITHCSQKLQTPETKKGIYEGCLSIPHHYSPLSRSLSVTVKYQTIDNLGTDLTALSGELIEKTETFTGFPAHIIQHEIDHLNGILFIDH